MIASHRILWDAITYPCLGYLFLAPKSPYFLYNGSHAFYTIPLKWNSVRAALTVCPVCGGPCVRRFPSQKGILEHTCAFAELSAVLILVWIWWCRGMEDLSALLTICAGNPSITDRFPSQRASNLELWFIFCLPDQAVEQTAAGDLRRLNRHVMLPKWQLMVWHCKTKY